MRKFMGIFTTNWGLKLLALVLAIVVYYSLKQTTHGRTEYGAGAAPNLFLKGAANGGK